MLPHLIQLVMGLNSMSDMVEHPISLQRAVYEILEIAPPDHRLSRCIQYATIWLVCLNTLALLLSCVDVFRMYHIYVFWLVEALSSAVFTVEYGLECGVLPPARTFVGASALACVSSC